MTFSLISQEQHKDELAWLVGIIEGDDYFYITKKHNCVQFVFGIELATIDLPILWEIKRILNLSTNPKQRKKRSHLSF